MKVPEDERLDLKNILILVN